MRCDGAVGEALRRVSPLLWCRVCVYRLCSAFYLHRIDLRLLLLLLEELLRAEHLLVIATLEALVLAKPLKVPVRREEQGRGAPVSDCGDTKDTCMLCVRRAYSSQRRKRSSSPLM